MVLLVHKTQEEQGPGSKNLACLGNYRMHMKKAIGWVVLELRREDELELETWGSSDN